MIFLIKNPMLSEVSIAVEKMHGRPISARKKRRDKKRKMKNAAKKKYAKP
jgi:hypothetical protein